MNYWIFTCNPKKYHINERLEDPQAKITWRVTRYKKKIQPGDYAFIWRTGPDRGICAVMEIDSAPQYNMPELDSEKPYIISLETKNIMRVLGTLTLRFPCISHKVLRSVLGLENLSIFHGFRQATNFPVTPEEGEIMMNLIR